jgi:predicted NBD/HSP70 family sugar kinase
MTDSSEARILALVAHSAGVSRVDLQARLGLPPTTVTSAVGRLLRRGAVTETAGQARRATSGRRPALLYPAGEQRLLGLVSWSRTGLRAVLCDFAGTELQDWQYPVTAADPLADPMAALKQAAGGRLIAVVVSVSQPYQQGVGSPAQPGEASLRLPQPGWLARFETDPAPVWSQRMAVPVLFENDANLEALGEAVSGAAAGEKCVIYIKLGERTTGAGLVLDGRLYRGASGFAGELAHVHLVDDGNLCVCGGRGCLLTRLGPALVESIRETFGADVSFSDVLARAIAGDRGPVRILGDIGRMVGTVTANLVTFLNPSALVIGGTLGPATRIVVDGLRESVEHFTSPVAASAVRIVAGDLGNRAELLGAIAVSREQAVAQA